MLVQLPRVARQIHQPFGHRLPHRRTNQWRVPKVEIGNQVGPASTKAASTLQLPLCVRGWSHFVRTIPLFQCQKLLLQRQLTKIKGHYQVHRPQNYSEQPSRRWPLNIATKAKSVVDCATKKRAIPSTTIRGIRAASNWYLPLLLSNKSCKVALMSASTTLKTRRKRSRSTPPFSTLIWLS